MKKLLLLLLLLLFSFYGFSQVKTKEKEMQNMYLSFLKSEGYSGKITSLGNIFFKKEGDSYYIYVSEDELFFQVFKYLNNKKEGCSRKVKRIVKALTGGEGYKSLNVLLVNDDCEYIKLSSESLLANKKDYESVFSRSINILGYGEKKIQKLYSEE